MSCEGSCDGYSNTTADEEVNGSGSDEPGLDYLQRELGSVSCVTTTAVSEFHTLCVGQIPTCVEVWAQG